MIRSFIAIELLPEIKRNLSRLIDEINNPPMRRLRWVPVRNIHLTLKFIGEIQEKKVSVISQKMAEAAKKFDTFDIQIGGLGAFPGIEKPRVVWIACDISKEGYALQKEIETCLVPLGIEQEKRVFHPHLTLARASRSIQREDYSMITEAIRKNRITESWRMRVDQVKLYRSNLSPGGAQYRVISTASLEMDI